MDLAEYFRSVMELSHGIVVTLDDDDRVIHGNRLMETVTGRSLADLKGLDWFEAVVPESDREAARRQCRRCAGQAAIGTFRGRIQSRHGTRIHVEWRLKSLADAGGGHSGVMLVGHDVTAHVSRRRDLIQECADLAERNRELTCLYGVAHVAENLDRDLDAILSDIIDRVPPALQFPEASAVALTVDDRLMATPGYDAAGDRLAEDIVVRGICRGSLRVSTAAGAAAATPPPTREEAELLAVVARQAGLIIAKKEALAAESDLQVQLRHADRLAKIGQLAAGVAHELNEPLANILGFAQLAAKTAGLPVQVEKDLGHVVRAALHAREVIKKLMLFSRQVPPQKMQVDLNRIIGDALDIAAASALRRGVTVARDTADPLPEITADPQQLRQVVINLSANAIQAMPEGGVLTIGTHTDGQHVYMRVEDTGCGMDPGIAEQVFNPFFTTKDVDQGSGLGLSVVHGIVKAHGGSIDVHSEKGKGTTFTVSFPMSV